MLDDDESFAGVPQTGTAISVWGVERTDVLNVREAADPAASIIERLEHDAVGLAHTGAVETAGTQTWWEIVTPDGNTGWVNRRYLAVARFDLAAEQEDRLHDAAVYAFDFFVDGSSRPLFEFAESFSIGGIGIFADAPLPFQPVDPQALETPRDWDLGFDSDPDECPECRISPRAFVGIELGSGDEVIVTSGPGEGYSSRGWGVSTGLPPSFYENLVTVTFYKPSPDAENILDWSRHTFVFDYRDEEPLLAGVFVYGWTP